MVRLLQGHIPEQEAFPKQVEWTGTGESFDQIYYAHGTSNHYERIFGLLRWDLLLGVGSTCFGRKHFFRLKMFFFPLEMLVTVGTTRFCRKYLFPL